MSQMATFSFSITLSFIILLFVGSNDFKVFNTYNSHECEPRDQTDYQNVQKKIQTLRVLKNTCKSVLCRKTSKGIIITWHCDACGCYCKAYYHRSQPLQIEFCHTTIDPIR